MGRLGVLVVLAALVAPGSLGLPSDPVAQTLGSATDAAAAQAVPALEREVGQNLHSEDVAMDILLDARNVDDDVVGIAFGGGKVGLDVDAHLHIEFRAISTRRLAEAVRALSGEANVSLERDFGIPVNRTAVTAEELRLAGAGVLLAAFQDFEAEAAAAQLRRTLPGLDVLRVQLSWNNTLPFAALRQTADQPPAVPRHAGVQGAMDVVPLREPPLVLDGLVQLRYLDRFSLYSILRTSLAGTPPSGHADLQRRIEENQTEPLVERSAFRIMGLSQLLAVQLPPGWSMHLVLRVPKGFTIEGATDELAVTADRREMSYSVDGSDRSDPLRQSAVATLSNRFLVTTVLLVAALLAGIVVRLPAEVIALSLLRRAFKRHGGSLAKRTVAQRVADRLPANLVGPPPHT